MVKYMNKNYITKIELQAKEILGDLAVALPSNTMTHLIVTGKHGSGKTTLLKYIKEYLEDHEIEGIVFWLNGEPVCKIKRTDFGLKWPIK